MTLSLELMTDTLPVGFAELEADAKTDGHGHLTRLAAEFAQSPAIFHAIFARRLDGRLAGIGAITDEPALTSQPTRRMWRLTCIANLDGARLRAPLRTPCCKKQRRTFSLLRYMQEMKARPDFGRQSDSAQLPVAPGLTKQQRLAHSWGVRYTNDRSRQASAGPMCPFLLHVGLALDLDLHARIYQPFHLNERRDR
jgi:hypothetical protein